MGEITNKVNIFVPISSVNLPERRGDSGIEGKSVSRGGAMHTSKDKNCYKLYSVERSSYLDQVGPARFPSSERSGPATRSAPPRWSDSNLRQKK